MRLFGSRVGDEFDLNRVTYRLDGIGHFGSVAALLMNAALVVLSLVPKQFDENKTENFAKITGAALVCATIVFGTYTAMVFSLLSLYSKTFLGMGKDEEFLIFFDRTSDIRDSAFFSFVGTILSFNVAFVMTLYVHTEGRLRFWLTTGAAILIGICAYHWFLIMYSAAKLLENSQFGMVV